MYKYQVTNLKLNMRKLEKITVNVYKNRVINKNSPLLFTSF